MLKLNSILFVDDDETTSTYQSFVASQSGYFNDVVVMNTGEEALVYLSGFVGKGTPAPEVIFVDLNMPGMDGWEFCERFETIRHQLSNDPCLIILSTANPEDHAEKVEEVPCIHGFRQKPLTHDILDEIVGSMA
ncbi:MAG: response regulator [Flavobacteriales bacterium]|nr:response regulator [Flavobacteriales bacterium]